MKANDKHVVDFLRSRCTYSIPVYQRNYDWGIDNCKKLVNDIILAEQNKLKEYFLGSFVTVQKNDSDRSTLYIIDGQQRLTSLTLLLLAIYNNDASRKSEIDTIIFTDTQEQKKTLILKQIQKDDEYLAKIINEGILHKEDSNIIHNYLFFQEIVQQDLQIIDTIMHGINRLRFVHIELDNSDQPQLVFETLNATGKELSEADKIRNFILMYKEQEHLYENYWVKIEKDCLQHTNQNSISNFMKAFLTIVHRSDVTKPIKDGNVYEVFKDYYNNKSNKNNKDILNLMKKYSSCYHKILSPNSYEGNYINSLRNIQELDLTVLNPLILCILKLEQDSILCEETTVSFIKTLENYLVRRRLSDTQSNALNKVAFALSINY